MRIANKDYIEELLFNRRDIKSYDIAKSSGIPYVSITQYRSGTRNYTGMNLDYAIELSNAYQKLKGDGNIDSNRK